MDMSHLRHPKDGKAAPSLDRAESRKARRRSGGWCEVIIRVAMPGVIGRRCPHRATQIHHLIGGRGKRGVGRSALAQHKLAVCEECHRKITGDIGGKKLKRIGGPVPVWTDPYEEA